MNPEIKQKWIAALESGEYRQGENYLQNKDNCFCCLGVLCDIYAKENNVEWTKSDDYGNPWSPVTTGPNMIHDNGRTLPSEVMKWAEIGEDSPGESIFLENIQVDSDSDEVRGMLITELNDECGWDFKRLANLIKERL
jgi:hypothetical protein